jgi:PIN domain nuclease of toxin-antitoxin system
VSTAVADTHAVIWYLTDDPRLSSAARALFTGAAVVQDKVALSSISLVEVVYLEQKARVPPGTRLGVEALLTGTNPLLAEMPVDRQIAGVVAGIDRSLVPDMPDRIIAATAVYLGVPVKSRDGKIQSSGITTVW